MVDIVIQGKTRKRHEFCAFYTKSDPILTYMVKRLQIQSGDVILEPCAGDGVFIEKIIGSDLPKNFTLEAVDLNSEAVHKLSEKFETYSNIHVRQSDILLEDICGLFGGAKSKYTKVIGNPPYGAWQDYKKRKLLKDIYGGYVRETYALFIRKCCDLLKEQGRLVFIVPDTFLSLHLHKGLRQYLVTHTKIEEILLIPSKFFPGVKFGYSNLCIITLVKSTNKSENQISIVAVKDSINELYQLANYIYEGAHYHENVKQKDASRSEDFTFMVGLDGDKHVRNILERSTLNICDIADCVTGFYSGNNEEFIATGNHTARNHSKYKFVCLSEVELNPDKQKDALDGLANGKRFVPILKGSGTSRFLTQTDLFVQWDRQTVEFYKKDQRARFQNPRYYFREGIGVPMVRSGNLRAFLLEKRLFDQSVVGIFPKDTRYLNYLLAFLNSDMCTRMLKAINHTANNSANYLKRIPIAIEDSALLEINRIMESYYLTKETENALVAINKVFNSLFGILPKK